MQFMIINDTIRAWRELRINYNNEYDSMKFIEIHATACGLTGIISNP